MEHTSKQLGRRAWLLASAALGCTRRTPTMSQRMPALFVGHGSPMNAIDDNRWSRAFAALGPRVRAPRAVLAISAHWYVDGTFLTGPNPRTIHDFRGFPPALREVQYPAPGSTELTDLIRARIQAEERQDWGLDHGTWSVLKWVFPDARVPVVQLSIDRRLAPEAHVALGRALRPLRDEGVLIFGSGNLVHNLPDAFARGRTANPSTPRFAGAFDEEAARAAQDRDVDRACALAAAPSEAHPSVEHLLPFLYTLGASDEHDSLSFPIEGFDWGSISMRSVLWS